MSFQGLMVRKALADSGAIKTPADLKGRKIAFTGPGATDSVTIDDALRPSGAGFNDVESIYLGLPAQLAAYQNGAIDASVMPEPFRTTAISKGLAVELMPVGEIRNNHQTGAVVYSQVFIKNRPEVAQKLMNAYIRGVRYYNDTLKDGKISGPHAEEIIDATAKHSTLKDKTVLRAITPVAIDPDGMLSVDSLKADLAFYKAQGLVKSKISVDDLVDLSFVKKAVEQLGPYKTN
jgi:NitT/TauT family transport system substrate-binding protein